MKKNKNKNNEFMVIDGVTYYKEKQTDKKKIKPFEIFGEKEYSKIIKGLSSIFSFADTPILQDEALRKKILVKLDPPNVCLAVANTDRAKDILRLFIDNDSKMENKPDLDYTKHEKNKPSKSKYSIYYLQTVIKFFEYENNSLKISTKNNYPITIENKDFSFIIAPRVEGDD